MQRKHDREQEASQPLFPKDKVLTVSEREIVLSERGPTSSIKYRLFKAALRKNLLKMNFFKPKSADIPQAVACTTRRHWCDIDDDDNYVQDVKISLEILTSDEPHSVSDFVNR
ncbi:protein of unknown function [Taphrina deformans PYCC 5710]|uniref:Uncharacterized protein n=1 Tax=Taphrina deformans (strain PYCC 5710 / ATCC 11124 / CBS 356.35 / IMI 108563 / JCM 9778 / NBRC 8474) TaxID=1097556 RepID=R4X744_TAPDE|nr:protein of unknown function [Taphrina deformans PYCC 5710]|eukprot:CCG81071.1 protein of unknown function [Taphrina deformans PYCC 5710]